MPRAGKNGLAALLVCASGLIFSGCGTPGAPQPPSLNLPGRVGDLNAVRTGNQVELTWTMPRRNTDRLLLKNDVPARICWQEGTAACAPVGNRNFAPGADAEFHVELLAALSSGPPRPIRYYVELVNSAGRSAGFSNAATVLGGAAPASVDGLGAEVRKSGVVLRWTAGDGQQSVRLRRVLLNPPQLAAKKNPLAPPSEPVEQNLMVTNDAGIAIDKGVHFGETYEYRAQRVAILDSEGKATELAGDWSAPVRVPVADVFPPAVPVALAAVATAASVGVPASIDLNWQPVEDPSLAGYFVYRREEQTPWRRISGDKPIVPPAFHDADVRAGHTYIYGVSSVDQRGNESGRSVEASESVVAE